MSRLLRRTACSILLVVSGAAWSGAVSTLVGNGILDRLEAAGGRPLSYEEALRVYIVVALLLFLGLWFSYLLRRVTWRRLLPWLAVTSATAGVVVIALIDQRYSLHDERSGLRWVTGGFLALTSWGAGLVARSYGSDRRSMRRWWWILTLGFALVAIAKVFMLPMTVRDLLVAGSESGYLYYNVIRVGVALAALVFVVFLIRRFLREYVPRQPTFVQVSLFGVLVVGVAQVFDVFDFLLHEGMVALGVELSADKEFLFSDLWYPLWMPQQLLNALDEVLECLASAILCAGVLVLLVETRRPGVTERRLAARPGFAAAALAAMVLLSITACVWLAVPRDTTSPATDVPARAVLGATDGLFHSDMLFYHPRWGLLLANEGRGNIVVYRDGKTDTLPDRRGIVEDTDSVTATSTAVYVSSPSLRTVFRYTKDDGWSPFVTAEHGLGKPEGLVIVGASMYVVDELFHRIYRVDMDSRQITVMRLEDARWQSPEGIAYHPGLERLLVTDEVSGYVTAVEFGQTPAVFASPEDGLVSPEDLAVAQDGRVYVTDTERREVVEFSPDGNVLGRIRFRRMYGYVVGVEVVEKGGNEVLYVVTSDGFGSAGFMPSMLWELRPVLERG